MTDLEEPKPLYPPRNRFWWRATSVVAFRVLSALLFRDPQVSMLAERVQAEDLPFVVSLESRRRYAGTG
jgi:hypothetical protein